MTTETRTLFPLLRYLLVEWDTYYPLGSLGNITDSFNTFEEARTCVGGIRGYQTDHAEIWDTETGELLWSKYEY